MGGPSSLLASLLVSLILEVELVSSQFICPGTGIYPDPEQCDKYWVGLFYFHSLVLFMLDKYNCL